MTIRPCWRHLQPANVRSNSRGRSGRALCRFRREAGCLLALPLVSAEHGTSMRSVSATAPVLAELPELLVAGSMLEAVTAFGRRVQVRVESVDGAGVDVACPDGILVPGMPVTVRVATGGGVAFVQLGVERIESTGAWAHARLRASAVLSVDGERRFSRCRYAGTVWLGGRPLGCGRGRGRRPQRRRHPLPHGVAARPGRRAGARARGPGTAADRDARADPAHAPARRWPQRGRCRGHRARERRLGAPRAPARFLTRRT